MAALPEIVQGIQVGETVVYSDSFLDRHGKFHIDMPSAHGKVKALHHVRNLTLAGIHWNRPGLPKRVNVKYLTRTMISTE
jgi:hypothetical protein